MKFDGWGFRKPYIGVTGIIDAAQAEELAEIIPDQYWAHWLMSGVLVSSKTKVGLPNKYPGVYPPVEQLPSILCVNVLQCISIVHYNTDNPEQLLEELISLTDMSGRCLQGFQLNQCWPDRTVIEQYLNLCRPQRLILQIGTQALEVVGRNPVDLAEKVREYRDLISDVLIDPSGGRGQAFDQNEAALFIEKLQGLGIGIGIAGGLGPDTLSAIEPLFKEYPRLSFDAQGRLQTDGALDMAKARSYLRAAVQMIDRLDP